MTSLEDVKLQLSFPNIATQAEGFVNLVALIKASASDSKKKKRVLSVLWSGLRCGPSFVSNLICDYVPTLISEGLVDKELSLTECLLNSSEWTNANQIFRLILKIDDEILSSCTRIFAHVDRRRHGCFISALKFLELKSFLPCLMRLLLDGCLDSIHKQELINHSLNMDDQKLLRVLICCCTDFSFINCISLRSDSPCRTEYILTHSHELSIALLKSAKLDYPSCLLPLARCLRSSTANLATALFSNSTFPYHPMLLTTLLSLRECSRHVYSGAFSNLAPAGFADDLIKIIRKTSTSCIPTLNAVPDREKCNRVCYLYWIASDCRAMKRFLTAWLISIKEQPVVGHDELDLLVCLFPKLNSYTIESFLNLLIEFSIKEKALAKPILYIMMLIQSAYGFAKMDVWKWLSKLDANNFMIASLLRILLALAMSNDADIRSQGVQLVCDIWLRNEENLLTFEKIKPFLKIDHQKDDWRWQNTKMALIKRVCWEAKNYKYFCNSVIETLVEILKNDSSVLRTDAITALRGLCTTDVSMVRTISSIIKSNIKRQDIYEVMAYLQFLASVSALTDDDQLRIDFIGELYGFTKSDNDYLAQTAWLCLSCKSSKAEVVLAVIKSDFESSVSEVEIYRYCLGKLRGAYWPGIIRFLRKLVYSEIREYGRAIYKKKSGLDDNLAKCFQHRALSNYVIKKTSVHNLVLYKYVVLFNDSSALMNHLYDFLTKLYFPVNCLEENWREVILYISLWKQFIEALCEHMLETNDRNRSQVLKRIFKIFQHAQLKSVNAKANVIIALPFLCNILANSSEKEESKSAHGESDIHWLYDIFYHILFCATGKFESSKNISSSQLIFDEAYVPLAYLSCAFLRSFLMNIDHLLFRADVDNLLAELADFDPQWISDLVFSMLGLRKFPKTNVGCKFDELLNFVSDNSVSMKTSSDDEDKILLASVIGYNWLITRSLLDLQSSDTLSQKLETLLNQVILNENELQDLIKSFSYLDSEVQDAFASRFMKKLKSELTCTSNMSFIIQGLAKYGLICRSIRHDLLPRDYNNLSKNSCLREILMFLRKFSAENNTGSILKCLLKDPTVDMDDEKCLPPLKWYFIYKKVSRAFDLDIFWQLSLQEADMELFWHIFINHRDELQLHCFRLLSKQLRRIEHFLSAIQLKVILKTLFAEAKSECWDREILENLAISANAVVIEVWMENLPEICTICSFNHPLFENFPSVTIPYQMACGDLLRIHVISKDMQSNFEALYSLLLQIRVTQYSTASLIITNNFQSLSTCRRSHIINLVLNKIHEPRRSLDDLAKESVVCWRIFIALCASDPVQPFPALTSCDGYDDDELWFWIEALIVENFEYLMLNNQYKDEEISCYSLFLASLLTIVNNGEILWKIREMLWTMLKVNRHFLLEIINTKKLWNSIFPSILS